MNSICDPRRNTCKCGKDLRHTVYGVEADGCETQGEEFYGFCMTLHRKKRIFLLTNTFVT